MMRWVVLGTLLLSLPLPALGQYDPDDYPWRWNENALSWERRAREEWTALWRNISYADYPDVYGYKGTVYADQANCMTQLTQLSATPGNRPIADACGCEEEDGRRYLWCWEDPREEWDETFLNPLHLNLDEVHHCHHYPGGNRFDWELCENYDPNPDPDVHDPGEAWDVTGCIQYPENPDDPDYQHGYTTVTHRVHYWYAMIGARDYYTNY